MRGFLMSAVSLAALGTVADVVPLVDENRILVRHGLYSLRDRPLPGLAALLRVTKLDEKRDLSSEDLAFQLAPRLNAAGRLNQARLGVELLTTESPERAAALADYIHELNNQRTSLERKIYLAAHKQAKEQFDPEHDPALVLSGRDWHAGVVGIVASRLVEKYHRPVILLSLDELGARPASGSARSPEGLDLHALLGACREHLLSHGGHAAAAGLSIEEARIDAFRDAFCSQVAAETPPGGPLAELAIDAEAPFSQLTLATVRQIEELAPFGVGNPRPVLFAGGVELAAPPRRMGNGDRHLSARFRQHGTVLRAVAFGQGDWTEELAQASGPFDLAYRPVINDYRGRQSVEIHLVDWRLTNGAP
jgi:single-stranded-DNA-specific exonuclease